MVSIMVSYYQTLVKEQVDTYLPSLAGFYLAESKRAIIVGIPGVGKTTLITRAAEMLNQKRKTTVVIFGTIMFEEAKKRGLKNRDEMRRMTVEDQRHLQDVAAFSELQK